MAYPKAGSPCSSAGSARAIRSRLAGALSASLISNANSAESRPDATEPAFQVGQSYDRQDRRKPSIHLDEEPAVVVGRLSSTPHPAPQDDQLMSEHRILRLKPALRLERRGHHGQNKKDKKRSSRQLSRFFAQQARIGFSVHTGGRCAIRYTSSRSKHLPKVPSIKKRLSRGGD